MCYVTALMANAKIKKKLKVMRYKQVLKKKIVSERDRSRDEGLHAWRSVNNKDVCLPPLSHHQCDR